MKIRLWRGHHSPLLRELIARAWAGEELLILCPPHLESFEFLQALPPGPIQTDGDWDEARLAKLASAPRGTAQLPQAILGVFTSGTASGRPRLILYSRRNIEASLTGIRSFFDTARITSIFCYPQPFHTFGLTLGYVHAIAHGLELVTGEGPYSRAFHELWLERARAGTLTLGTPTHLHDLIAHVEATGARPRGSYASIVGGAKVSVQLWNAMKERLEIAEPSIGYGASEASPGIAHHPPGRRPSEDGEIGFVLPNVQASLRPGEGVEVSGESLCLALVEDGRLERSRSILIRDELEQRADGVLLYRGRLELLLNRGGQKHSLERIEERILAELGLQTVCVSVPDERLVEDLGILARAGDATSAREAIAKLLLDEFSIRLNPARLATAASLPFNESMKIDRKRAARIVQEAGVFPLAVQELAASLPHRGQAIWIDRVLSLDARGGECEVVLKKGAHYFGPDGLRHSSCIEWLAQAYGYVTACRERDTAVPPARVFLAAARGLQFQNERAFRALQPGRSVRVRVNLKAELGPLSLIEGEISADGITLARAELKLYADRPEREATPPRAHPGSPGA